MPITPFKSLPIRERRSGAINAYYGPLATLVEGFRSGEFAQRIRTLSQSNDDDILSALRLLRTIDGTVTIVHGARGCAAAAPFLAATDGGGGEVVSTDLSEDQSIMGAEEILRAAIQESYEYFNPQAVFVVTTPIVAINNDDVQSVAAELGAELNIPVVPVYTDGFKSKIGANGYDIAFHALAHYLIPRAQETRKEQVNLITSVEHLEDVRRVADLVSTLRVVPNVFPRSGGVANFARSTGSALSVVLRSEGRILGEALEREKKVPLRDLGLPIGLFGTSRWLRGVAIALDRSREAERVVLDRENDLTSLRKERPLEGRRVHISAEVALAVGLSDLVEEFGGRIVGLSLPTVDKDSVLILEKAYRDHGWDFPVHVADGQPFEQLNILRRTTPDLYLGGWGEASQVAREGFPSLCHDAFPLYGYEAVEGLVRRMAGAERQRAFVRRLSGGPAIYSESWLGKPTNWYIKQEVG